MTCVTVFVVVCLCLTSGGHGGDDSDVGFSQSVEKYLGV